MSVDMVEVPPAGAVVEEIVDRRTGRNWRVEVAPFLVATTVVTAGQWRQVYDGVGGNSAAAPLGDASLPKVDVTWRDAVRFCNELSLREGLTPAYGIEVLDGPEPRAAGWVPHDAPAPDSWRVTWDDTADGYRLPSDAEWQVACRAGTDGPRYGELDRIGWYAGNAGEALPRVALKEPNPWGLFDTLGGVWEWCWDLFDEEVYGSYRIIRGGGWADPHWSCRAGVRRKTNPEAAFDDVGFRVARSIRA